MQGVQFSLYLYCLSFAELLQSVNSSIAALKLLSTNSDFWIILVLVCIDCCFSWDSIAIYWCLYVGGICGCILNIVNIML